MKNILVTGATGYIGSHVVAELLKFPNYFNVIATSRSNHSDFLYDLGGGRFVVFDITKDVDSLKDVREVFGLPDVCIHLAWRNGFVHNDSSHIQDLSSHFKFLRALIDGGCKHIAVAGSFREYGRVNGMVQSSAFSEPRNLYTLSKLTLKKSLEIYLGKNSDVVFQWLRPFTIYGDDIQTDSIFSKIISWEKMGKEYFPFTDGEEEYDYLSVHNLAKQIVAVVDQNRVSGTIDCCSGRPKKLGQKINEFLEENKFHIRPQYGIFERRSYDSPCIYGDNSKIRAILRSSRFYANKVDEILS